MILLIKLILLTTIWNLGVEIIFSDGMGLENVRKWAEEKKSKWYEVIFWCVWCRPSIHSLIVYAAAIGIGLIKVFSWKLVVIYPFVVAGSSLLSGVIWSIYKLIEIKSLYYKHKEQNEFFDLKDRKFNHFNNKK
jgi:hypothetical protein